jgi:hypothetical protein
MENEGLFIIKLHKSEAIDKKILYLFQLKN